MAKTTSPLLPYTYELLELFGDRLRLARLRRKLTAKQVAALAGMVPLTLRNLEQGGAGVTIGAYLAVMQVLGIEHDLNHMVQADPVGRDLQDARLLSKTMLPVKKLRKHTSKDKAGQSKASGAKATKVPVKQVSNPKLPPQLVIEPVPDVLTVPKAPKVKRLKADKKSSHAVEAAQWDWLADLNTGVKS
jgi:transcriptional regulator with XRE-family HTH domain